MTGNITIEDLKKYLGPGLGLRKSKYLIEIPVPGIKGETLNVLCRSAGLPERNIAAIPVWHKGRKYMVRGETDYGNTYQISIVDDSNMSIRRVFDSWCETVDDSAPKNVGIIGASFEKAVPGLLGNVTSAIGAANDIKNALEDPSKMGDYFLSMLGNSTSGPAATYQTDVNIWQLDGDNKKVYGYKLQNAFPTQVGIVTLDDGDANTLSEFSVTLTFSEFSILENKTFLESLGSSLLGDDINEAISGTEALFD